MRLACIYLSIHSLNVEVLSKLTSASTFFGSDGIKSILILEREYGIIFLIASNPAIEKM